MTRVPKCQESLSTWEHFLSLHTGQIWWVRELTSPVRTCMPCDSWGKNRQPRAVDPGGQLGVLFQCPPNLHCKSQWPLASLHTFLSHLASPFAQTVLSGTAVQYHFLQESQRKPQCMSVNHCKYSFDLLTLKVGNIMYLKCTRSCARRRQDNG